jgi:hypothetical protein
MSVYTEDEIWNDVFARLVRAEVQLLAELEPLSPSAL